MRGPRRLNEQSELFAHLVADMKRDRPSPEPLEKLLDAINAMPNPETNSARLGGKTWMIFAGVGALAVVGVAVFTAQPIPVAARSTSGAAATRPASDDVVATPPPEAEIPGAAVAELPNVPSAAAASAQGASPRVAPPTSSRPSSSRHEFETIVAARRALTRSDTGECLSLLAVYEREFPKGQFALEAKVMRVEAVAASGERGRAAALARELLAREPENPYEARLRSLVSAVEDER